MTIADVETKGLGTAEAGQISIGQDTASTTEAEGMGETASGGSFDIGTTGLLLSNVGGEMNREEDWYARERSNEGDSWTELLEDCDEMIG